MAPQTHRPDGKALLAAVTTVASVYVYFLIFAQFGFLRAVNAAWADAGGVVNSILAGMGMAGMAGSVVAARAFAPVRGHRLVRAGLIICALATGGTPFAQSIAAFSGVALLTGFGIGLATVSLAGLLQPAVGREHLGLVIGVGTGLAYGFCNLPGIFDASVTTQAAIAAGAALVGVAATFGLKAGGATEQLVGGDYSRRSVALWVGIFLVLVFLDSAVFYMIQHTALKEVLWSGSGRQGLIAITHLTAAVLAGWALDQRGLVAVAIFAGAVLVLAAFSLSIARLTEGFALVYVAAVSAYSTALVFYPAHSARPGISAWIYAVAGWVGSALGIGLAQGREQLPGTLVLGAGGLLAISLMGRYFASRQGGPMNENSLR